MRLRMHLFILILASTLLATTLACYDDHDDDDSSSSYASMLNEPLVKFSAKVLKSLDRKENVVLSPISIHKGLSMVLLGTDPATQTESELIDALGLAGLTSDQIKFCHEEYSSIVAKFKEITKESREFYKNHDLKRENHYSWVKKPPILDVFNMIVTKDLGDVLPTYGNKVEKYYNSSIVKVSDQRPATKQDLLDKLNGWAKEVGFEQPIMKPEELDKQFAALLLSAIHIQGFWFKEFSEHKNTERCFFNYGLADKPVRGTSLSLSQVHAKYLELTPGGKAKHKFLRERWLKSGSASLFEEMSALNMHVIEVPLQGGLKFTVLEPLNSSGSGGELAKMQEHLLQQPNKTSEANNLSKMLALLDHESKLSDIYLDHISFPQFSFENTLNIKDPLKSMGLERVFDRQNAQVSNMMSSKVHIASIKHQAMIDVNKFGIKAAGVTKIQLIPLSGMFSENPIRIYVENPFMFIIRYQRLPLFIGQLVKL